MKHLILALILPLSVGAYDPDDLTLLKETKRCYSCDLSKANLAGANLEKANLERSGLWWANLEETNLRRARLDGANMKGAVTDYTLMLNTRIRNTTMPDGRVIYFGYGTDFN